jgi:hypothetical protein
MKILNLSHTKKDGNPSNLINTALSSAELEAALYREGIIKREADGCIVMESDKNKNRYITYPHDSKNAVIRVFIPNPDNGKKWQTRSIQAFALEFLYGEKYYRNRQTTTTCGNPFCITREHIKYSVSDELYFQRQEAYKRKKEKAQNKMTKPVVAEQPTKSHDLTEMLRVIELLGCNRSLVGVAQDVGIELTKAAEYRKMFIEAALGEGYTIDDFLQLRDIADGMRWAKERREKSPVASLREMLKTTPRQTMFDMFD